MSTLKHRRSLLTIACGVYAFLTLTLFYFVPTECRMTIDSVCYTEPTEHFEDHGSLLAIGQHHCSNPMGIGYPLFMIVTRALFGHTYTSVIVMQMILGLLCLLLVFHLASYFFSPTVSMLAAFLCAVNVGFILYPHYILGEMWLSFLLIFALERFGSFLAHKRYGSLALSGFIFGFSTLVKGAALFYIGFLILYLFFVLKQHWSKRFVACLLLTASFSLAPLGYVVRNKIVYGNYYFQTLTRLNLYAVFLVKVLSAVEGISISRAEDIVNERFMKITDYSTGEGWDELREMFFQKVCAKPHIALYVWLTNVVKTLFGLYTNHLKVFLYPHITGGDCSFFLLEGSIVERIWSYITFGTDSSVVIGIAVVEALWSLVRYVLVSISFLYMLFFGYYALFFFFASWIVYYPMLTGFDGCMRYRFMIEFVLMILAAFALVLLYSRLKRKPPQLFAS